MEGAVQLYRDAPDWRYSAAEFELKCDRDGFTAYTPSTDPFIIMLKRFLPVWRKTVDRRALREVYGPLAYVVDIHENIYPACPAHALEASMMARADASFFLEVNRAFTVPVVMLYTHLFFDVFDMADRPLWVERNIFSPASQLQDGLNRTGYIWKLVGYHGGMEMLHKICVTGQELEPPQVEWLKKHFASVRAAGILKAVHTPLPYEMEAISSNDIRKLLDSASSFAIGAIRAAEDMGPGDPALGPAAAEVVAGALKMREKGDKVTAQEYIEVQKYTDEDLKA